ncbi:MAG: DUF1289 domain-containing protein [Burkholderiales bacterium]
MSNRSKGDDGANPHPVESPCVNVCQIDSATGLCFGCMRSMDEIANWLEMTNEEKRQVLDRIEQRKAAA